MMQLLELHQDRVHLLGERSPTRSGVMDILKSTKQICGGRSVASAANTRTRISQQLSSLLHYYQYNCTAQLYTFDGIDSGDCSSIQFESG